MYQWENKLNITLTVPKRTKYRAGVHAGLGGTAKVGGTSPCVYVNSGTSVNYTVSDLLPGVTFKGWYLPTNVVADQALGYVASLGSTPVSTSTSYSKSITSDYELVAVFEGYNPPADWSPSTANSGVYVRDNNSWKVSQPYIYKSNKWTSCTLLNG